MKKFLLLLLFMPAIAVAQKKIYATALATANFPGAIGPGYGGEVGANFQLAGGIYAGASTGFIKFAETYKSYIPATINFIYFPASDKKTLAFFILSPGIGVYKNEANSTANNFTFFGGAGVMAGLGKVRPMVSVGYSNFVFEEELIKVKYQGVSVKFGFAF